MHEIEVHGRSRLGRFHKILTFVGRGIEEEPEFDVPLDQRSALDCRKPGAHPGDHRGAPVAPGADLSVAWHGHHYAVREQSGYRLNKKAFSLPDQLFQMKACTPWRSPDRQSRF